MDIVRHCETLCHSLMVNNPRSLNLLLSGLSLLLQSSGLVGLVFIFRPRHVIGSIVSAGPSSLSSGPSLVFKIHAALQRGRKNKERTKNSSGEKKKRQSVISLGPRTDWVCLLGNHGGGLGLVKTGVSLSLLSSQRSVSPVETWETVLQSRSLAVTKEESHR